MEKYRTSVNGRLFEISSNMPLNQQQQQEEVLKYIQQRAQFMAPRQTQQFMGRPLPDRKRLQFMMDTQFQ